MGEGVRRCVSCYGLLLDHTTYLRARGDRDRAMEIDLGSDVVGAKLSEQRACRCPQCGAAMRSRSDLAEHDVRIESCPSCESVWLDAGELRNLARFTPEEWLRSLFAPPQPE